MVLLTNISLEHARLTAERIRQKVYDLKIPHMFNESVATNVTISIGIAIFEDDDVEARWKKRIKPSTKRSIWDVITSCSAKRCRQHKDGDRKGRHE
jgi:GGDEF domain-containing protein